MPEWITDAKAMLKGWQVLIRGKLYYDAGTQQYYDANGKRLTYGEVQSQFNFDPLRPESVYQIAPLTERGAVSRQWQTPEGGYNIPPEARGAFAGWRPQPTPTTTARTQAEPKAVPGYTWVPQYDLDGNVATWELVPERLPAGELTPMEQWQIDQQKWQMGQVGREWQQEQYLSRQNLLAAQWNAQRARWAAQAGRPREDTAEQSRIWQSAQREILAQYDPVRDFTKRWEISQRQDPYAAPSSNIAQAQEYYDEAKAEYTRRKAAANIMRKRMKDPQDPLSQVAPEKEPSPEQWYAQQVLRAEKTAEDQFLRAESSLEGETYSWGGETSAGYPGHPYETETGETGTSRQYGMESSEPPRPWHPETPSWMTKFYPEKTERQLWGEKGGWRPKVAPPSGQAWSRLKPSERQQWMGYTEQWLGQKPLDLLQQTAQMLPREPQIAQRWQAARQRA